MEVAKQYTSVGKHALHHVDLIHVFIDHDQLDVVPPRMRTLEVLECALKVPFRCRLYQRMLHELTMAVLIHNH